MQVTEAWGLPHSHTARPHAFGGLLRLSNRSQTGLARVMGSSGVRPSSRPRTPERSVPHAICVHLALSLMVADRRIPPGRTEAYREKMPACNRGHSAENRYHARRRPPMGSTPHAAFHYRDLIVAEKSLNRSAYNAQLHSLRCNQ